MRGRLTQRYLVALGSNMRVPGLGGPRRVLRKALAAMEGAGLTVETVSPLIDSAPLGPSARRFANGAAVVASDRSPPELLALLQQIERAFGRRRRGRKWRARPLDLDIVLWSGGAWSDPSLTVPHRAFRARVFVLAPAAKIAPAWRDPVTGLTLLHLRTRLTRPRLVPSERPWSGP